MKRLLTILLTIFVSTTAFAKIEHTIIIDEGTFKPVQKDNLTGLNIDPISKDSNADLSPPVFLATYNNLL